MHERLNALVRLEQESKDAAAVQMAFLPGILPPCRVTISGIFIGRPFRWGGDYYDYLRPLGEVEEADSDSAPLSDRGGGRDGEGVARGADDGRARGAIAALDPGGSERG